MPEIYADRREAGRFLAQQLHQYANRDDVIVLALPRGGVPVAAEVADALNAPLDVFIVRKLGVPGHEELALGAIASGGIRVLNADVVRKVGLSDAQIERVTAQERQELQRRERTYRDDRPALSLKGRTVILVDDGVATGATMRAAVKALRELAPQRLIVAVPTAPPDVCRAFEGHADEVICAITPQPFGGVGAWYRDFAQTTDDEVRDLLRRAARRRDSSTGGGP